MILVTNSATGSICRGLGGGDVRYMLAEGLPRDWIVDSRNASSDLPVVLWVGRLLPRKAPSLALRAFAELRRRMSARLVIARDVELLGRVPWQEMRSLYDSADVFLFTSLRDSSGSQFLEALGRGLPAVALNHHGVGDTEVGTGALKVDLPPKPDDLPGRLATALEAVLSDGAWEARSEAAIRWAANHTWPAKAAAATKFYSEILSS
jgi:glycosyltransferase involved in cell wall biosynthesis